MLTFRTCRYDNVGPLAQYSSLMVFFEHSTINKVLQFSHLTVPAYYLPHNYHRTTMNQENKDWHTHSPSSSSSPPTPPPPPPPTLALGFKKKQNFSSSCLQSSWTHSGQSAYYPLPHTWDHRHPEWLVLLWSTKMLQTSLYSQIVRVYVFIVPSQ